MTNGNSAERERFESAMEGEPFYWHRNLWTTENGEYRELIAQAAWFAWQARAALSVCADGGKASSDVQDAERYRKCRARSITNGVAESAEPFDKMVDESIERVEVNLRTGHNYGKKMQPNGTLK